MMDLFPQIRQVAAEVFEASEEEITPESSPKTLENWDSIQHLNFVMSLEGRFHVQFSPEEMERIKSVGDAMREVAKKQGDSS